MTLLHEGGLQLAFAAHSGDRQEYQVLDCTVASIKVPFCPWSLKPKAFTVNYNVWTTPLELDSSFYLSQSLPIVNKTNKG